MLVLGGLWVMLSTHVGNTEAGEYLKRLNELPPKRRHIVAAIHELHRIASLSNWNVRLEATLKVESIAVHISILPDVEFFVLKGGTGSESMVAAYDRKDGSLYYQYETVIY